MELNNLPSEIDPEFLKRIVGNPKLVRAVIRESMLYFFYLIFGEYAKKPIAPFHREMFRLAEDESIKRIGIIAFRSSAKSTLWNTTYALWAIMGKLQKKHVVIVSHTQTRVADHSANIAREVKNNARLRRYLGPFLEERDERWSVPVRVIPRYGARITFASVEEGIRGVHEGPNRPDLIIVDDIEDTNSVRTKEGRGKVFDWLNNELIPAGTTDVKVVFIGNFLHDDSALMRIKAIIDEGKMDGAFMKVPIADDDGNPTWPGMFPTKESLQEFRRSLPSETAWQLEYMLKFVPEGDQIIKPEDIRYYDAKPQASYLMSDGMAVGVMPGLKGTGVDLAISKKETADYTAMVSGQVIFENEVPKLYIEPNPFKGRVDFRETIEQALAILKSSGGFSQFFVENVAYQQAAVKEFERHNIPVCPMQATQDKWARLRVAALYIKNGMVLFPRKGCEELIHQLIYFGQESHDDLVDALVYLILGTVNANGMDLLRVVAL